MNNKEIFYPESFFGGFTDIDGTIAFFNRVNSLLEPSFTVLDVGCGRGASDKDPVPLRRNLRILRGKVARVIGIDVDPDAQKNPFLDEFHLLQGDAWPLENDSVDLIVCDNVLEHVANPERFFLEIRRVLKNAGFLCIRTANRWSYIAIAATFIPDRYHSMVLSAVQDGRERQDIFPTVHKCNSIRKIRSIMTRNGLEPVVYGYEAEPSYLAFSAIAYFFGVIHQKFAPAFIKPAIFAFGKMKK